MQQIKDAVFIGNFYVDLLLACYVLFLLFLGRNKLDRFTIPMCEQMEVSYINFFFFTSFSELRHFRISEGSFGREKGGIRN